ncbi:hypothetical protein [Rhizomonospora bruguierae]|uniref:hypothetical protein n=1 Tax=Rhizomonospora bruguierae TaxID=1581705 RepID=UPI001BCAAA80|nr:hypothetical protein [Micromonospora sp. NBRC 107566]
MPTTTPPTDPKAAALARVRAAVAAKAAALAEHDRAILTAVADARRHAATWTEVADATGQKRPNAERKFKPLLVEERRVTVRESERP